MEATVDEAKRREFESDWAMDSIDISDYLPVQSSDQYLPTLEELVCIDLEFYWRSLTKTPDKPERFVEWYLTRFPELHHPAIVRRLVDHEAWVRRHSSRPAHADEYIQRFPDVTFTDSTYRRLASQCATLSIDRSEQQGFHEPRKLPGEIQGYRILSELGRGGMGVVFLAEQESSGRRVAIKLATIANLSKDTRQEHLRRVQQEIRASAGLRHDHIMPVFEVGDLEGQPFYTMPVMDTDLGSKCKSETLADHTAARYIAQAARGVHAAHEQGLFHRDLKPQNLMLDEATDRVLVTDFGLARWQSESQELTRTGQVLGTPPFMPPEQIRDATSVDARADVYALGASLYHLLTGRPPIVGSEIAETLRLVMEQDPIPVREQNPNVDLDLETICMRCLQKEPAQRYASAAELADDLDRYQRDEPIVARPLTTIGRLNRWRRRNPTPARLVAGLFLSLIGLAAVGWLGWNATRKQFLRYQTSVRQGHQNIDDLFELVRNDPILQEPGEEELRRSLLEKGREHYQTLAQIAEGDDALLVDQVVAEILEAVIQLELDGPAVARESLEASLQHAARLPGRLQAAPKIRVAIGDALNGLGKAQRKLGQIEESRKTFDEAIIVRQELAKLVKTQEAQRKLANAWMNRGLVLLRMRQWEQAADDMKAAQSERKRLLKLSPNDLKLRRDHAQGVFNLVRLKALQGQWDDAIESLNEATRLFEKLTTEYPTISQLWLRRVQCLQTQSMLRQSITASNQDIRVDTTGFHAEPLLEAIEILRVLSNLAPNNRSYLIELATLYHQTVDDLLASGERESAERLLSAAKTEILSRIAKDPPQLDHTLLELHQQRLQGLLLLENGGSEAALKDLRDVLKAWESATESIPSGVSDPDGEWRLLRTLLEQLRLDLDPNVG
ncbi:MAG: serine/threonine-protein kinase [Planctomycetota bacterium]